MLVDIQEFLDLPQFRGYTDLEFCEWMIKNIGVAAVPGSSGGSWALYQMPASAMPSASTTALSAVRRCLVFIVDLPRTNGTSGKTVEKARKIRYTNSSIAKFCEKGESKQG